MRLGRHDAAALEACHAPEWYMIHEPWWAHMPEASTVHQQLNLGAERAHAQGVVLYRKVHDRAYQHHKHAYEHQHPPIAAVHILE
eukprot:11871366-Alexandrium_andersonii.AAC.1